jgi:hypothetical protein
MNTLRRYFRLTPFERRIVAQCSLGLVMTWAGLRVVGFGWWKAVVVWLTPSDCPDCDDGESSGLARIIIRMQAAAERRIFFKPSCLEHSLVLWWLFRRHGIPANLRIGGRKEQGRFQAHAWVEIAGVPLGDAGSAHRNFVPFDGPVSLIESQTH